MKILFTLILSIFLSLNCLSQDSSIEKNFEKNRKSFFLTHFSVGEDASSGFDYLVYRQKTSTKKIRVIWSNYSQATVDDYYFDAGKPVLLVKYEAKHNQYKSLAKGIILPLKTLEKYYFTNSKLISWFENGKPISNSDSRWAEKEKELLASFDEQLETFRSHLRGEL
ncbi:MAG: hypothetical protein K1X72_09450 [Pyrinomonadaceae bacterium]|nr:hypothetical protein [Pyrinomonadaceae bacterium]